MKPHEESIYQEYANWKITHHDLLQHLKENHSDLMIRFRHVLDVTDFLYDKLIDDPNFTEEEHHIFETGFYYIFDQIDKINQLCQDVFHGKMDELEKYTKEVNLLLSTIDFQNELLSHEQVTQDAIDDFHDFETMIESQIRNKQHVSNELFDKLDHMSYRIFNQLNIEFYPINDIFFDIADELGIL